MAATARTALRWATAPLMLLALMPTPAGADGPPVATGEPNETAAAAQGPLLNATTYSGVTDSNTDEDWLFVSAGPGTAQLTVSVSQPARGTCVDDSDGAFATLYGANPESSDALGQVMAAGVGTPLQFTATVTGPATYWLDVGTSCAPGAAWLVRVDTTGTLTQTPAGDTRGGGAPPATGTPSGTSGTSPATSPKSPATCARAQRSTRRWSRRVSGTERELKRARRTDVRRLLRRILTLERTTLRHVRARAKLTC